MGGQFSPSLATMPSQALAGVLRSWQAGEYLGKG
jgi:hypothetical protein